MKQFEINMGVPLCSMLPSEASTVVLANLRLIILCTCSYNGHITGAPSADANDTLHFLQVVNRELFNIFFYFFFPFSVYLYLEVKLAILYLISGTDSSMPCLAKSADISW